MIRALPKPKKTKPADWGVGVTVCIAAVCNSESGDEVIVTASDQMISTGHYSADNITMKIDPIHPNWEAMFSADNLSKVVPILHRVRLALKDKPAGFMQVRQAFLDSFRAERALLAEETVLSPFSLTLDDLIKNGQQKLGQQVFASLLQRIEALSLGCTFLVCGFGEKGEAHIMTVDDPGESQVHDLVGCWAIGSGQHSALSNLFFRSQIRLLGIAPTVFNVCESKFMAETAFGVGKLTFVVIKRFKQPQLFFREDCVDALREIWEKEIKRPVPRNLYSKILGDLEYYDSESGESKPLIARKSALSQ